MDELHKVAGVLMEREKISGEEFKTLMEGGTCRPMTSPAVRPPSPKHLRRKMQNLCSLPNNPQPRSLPSRTMPSPTRKSKE